MKLKLEMSFFRNKRVEVWIYETHSNEKETLRPSFWKGRYKVYDIIFPHTSFESNHLCYHFPQAFLLRGSLEVMLVMTTIFMSKMESLPPTVGSPHLTSRWSTSGWFYAKSILLLRLSCSLLWTIKEQIKMAKRKKKKRGKGKSEAHVVKSMSRVDENENLKTKWEAELAGFVSRWKVPGLKTLGRLLTTS